MFWIHHSCATGGGGLFGLYNPEEEGTTVLRNANNYSPIKMEWNPRRLESSSRNYKEITASSARILSLHSQISVPLSPPGPSSVRLQNIPFVRCFIREIKQVVGAIQTHNFRNTVRSALRWVGRGGPLQGMQWQRSCVHCALMSVFKHCANTCNY